MNTTKVLQAFRAAYPFNWVSIEIVDGNVIAKKLGKVLRYRVRTLKTGRISFINTGWAPSKF